MEEEIKEFAFLKTSSHKDLKKLTDCLIFGVGNTGIHKKARWADELSKTQAYKDHKEDSLQNAVDVIIDEFLRCGGSTIMNKKRDGGVPYIEILRDICDRLYIYWHDDMPVTMIEKNLIIYVIERCLISNPQIVNELYSKWCEKLIIYQSNELSKMDCIMDFCLAKSNLIKTMAFIINELDKMVNTKAKDYNGWLKEIYKQVNSPSARTPLGVANKALHYFNPIALQGAAYDVTFPATLYIIYMRIKEQLGPNMNKYKFNVGDKVILKDRSDEKYNILTITSVIEEKRCYTCHQDSIIKFEEEDKWIKVK